MHSQGLHTEVEDSAKFWSSVPNPVQIEREQAEAIRLSRITTINVDNLRTTVNTPPQTLNQSEILPENRPGTEGRANSIAGGVTVHEIFFYFLFFFSLYNSLFKLL